MPTWYIVGNNGHKYNASTYYSASIPYERPFGLSDPEEKSSTMKINSKSKNDTAPCFKRGSLEEVFYCEERFKAVMQMLGKDPDQYLDEWEDTIVVDIAKDVWLEILDEGGPEDDGADFLRDHGTIPPLVLPGY